jgi:hypothetical protein
MTAYKHSRQYGAVSMQLVTIIGLLVLVVGLSGLSAWLFTQYSDQKNNVDSKIAVAEAAAKKEQAEEDELKIKAVEEEPNREFAGPEDYGRLSFKYPKNWSVYIAEDASRRNTYTAYLHPIVVPSIDSPSTRFALRVSIQSVPYDKVLEEFRGLIEDGELKSSTIKVNGHSGTRFDGNLTEDIRGSAAVFKVRDKTITISTQAETFKPYFNTIIKTVDFND